MDDSMPLIAPVLWHNHVLPGEKAVHKDLGRINIGYSGTARY